MQFITSGNRIAVENFTLGDLYTITFTNGNYINSACIGIGENFVSFQRNEPELLFTLNMETAELVSSIDLYAGGTGTNNYNELTNKPQIGGVELVGNKSLSDLGIQSEITAESPLSSAFVSGLGSAATAESTDFATAAQGALADTAVQPAALNDYQTLIDNDNKLSADLVDDTSTTNKFATSAQLDQIETNKNNILSVWDKAGRNELQFNGVGGGNDYTVSYTNNNGIVTVNGTATGGTSYNYLRQGTTNIDISKYCNGDYYLFGCPPDGDIDTKYALYASKGNYLKVDNGNGVLLTQTTETPVYAVIRVAQNYTADNLQFKPMIIHKSLVEAGDITFEPYAMSNAELTSETADLIDSTYGTSHNVDLDTLTKGGRYLVNGAESSTSNAPFANWQTVEVYESNLDGYTTLTVQIATELGAGLARKFRRRTYSGGGQYSAWTTWTS